MPPTDTSPPNLVLETVTPSTLDSWISVTNHTFSLRPAGSTIGFLDLFYPNGITPAITAWNRETHLKGCQTENFFFHIVRDTSLPGSPVVGTARWQLVPEAKSAAQMHAEEYQAKLERDAERHIPDVDHDRFDVFRVAQFKGKLDNVAGRPYLYLKSICTHPDHQRKGVGKVMMRWGLRKADELGVPMYLEASEAGRRLYEQSGFVERGYLDWDASRFEGVEDRFLNLAMLREPGTGEVKY
ncbi:hypothetical protein KVT40_009098 [Elsinoe batatas]|uniref:N-acetyltransferase domain-containing protein n=1 Tax=Elsinoe batatas TaxID=2601811 RepID=A0A8K0PD12_9PEZI|nr:hypothetical protein KVT40_009098 [Elsinoe batatas]